MIVTREVKITDWWTNPPRITITDPWELFLAAVAVSLISMQCDSWHEHDMNLFNHNNSTDNYDIVQLNSYDLRTIYMDDHE